MTTDAQRHAMKIRKFETAIGRVGFDRVSDKIGRGTFSAFESARDAQTRRQSPIIIAKFLLEAQVRGEAFCNLKPDENIYGVLASLK